MFRHFRKPLAYALVASALSSLGCGATRPRLDSGKPWEVAAEAVNHPPNPIPVNAPKLARPQEKVAGPVNPALKEKVTLRSDSTDIRSLLLGLSKQTGLNITLDEEVTGNVSAYLNDVEVLEALRRIVGPMGFALDVQENFVRVYEPSAETRIYRVQYLRGERSGQSRVAMIDRSSQSSGSTTGAAGGAPGGASPMGGAPGGAGGGSAGMSGGPGGTSLTEITSKFSVNFWQDLGAELESLIFDGARNDDLVRNDRKEAGISIYEKEELPPAPTTDPNAAPGAPGARPDPRLAAAAAATPDKRARKAKNRRSLTINSMSGTIVVRAKPQVLDAVGEYLTMVEETVRRQVVIDVRILEVSLSDQQRFGVDAKDMPLLPSQMLEENFSDYFDQGEGPRITSPLGFPAPTTDSSTASATDLPPLTQDVPSYGITIGKNNPGESYKLLVTALAKLGDVKVVSAPRISALHNQKAIVKVVRDRVYWQMQAGQTALSAGGTSVSSQAQFNPVVVPEGVVVDVTPLIADDGSVTLEIHPSFSVIFNEKAAPANQGSQPEVERREFQTTIHVKGEQTVVLGGLVTERTTRKESGLPYIKDIPYLGALFRKTDETVEKAELIVLLTPRVQGTPLAREMVNHQAKLVGEDPIPEPDAQPAAGGK